MKKIFIVVLVLAAVFTVYGICLAQDSSSGASSEQAAMSSDNEGMNADAGAAKKAASSSEEGKSITGTVEEVNLNGKYVVVGGKHYAIPDSMSDSFDMEVGDNVQIMYKDVGNGQEITDYSYM